MDFGGNTSCIEIRVNGNILIFDAGTGVIKLGNKILNDYFAAGGNGLLRINMFFTHLHHDHTQGLPFFKPAYLGTTQMFIFGPKMTGVDIYEHLVRVFRAPHFPVELDELKSQKTSQNLDESTVVLYHEPNSIPEVLNHFLEPVPADDHVAKIWINRCYSHPKTGVYNYKIEFMGKSVVIATDVEGYMMDDAKLINFSTGCDVLIHDAQYKSKLYPAMPVPKQGFGHSTPKMAARVAKKANVKKLYLFHHDPEHDDSALREMARNARRVFPNTESAYEVLEVDLFKINLNSRKKKT
jgi:ribonuclease BN (tRNA processing enzyme)